MTEKAIRSKPEGQSFRTAEIVLLSLAHFVHDIYTAFLSPLLPLLIKKFSMSLAQAGALSAIMQLPALLNPFVGMIADRMSLRALVILAPALTAVPMSLIGVAPSYGVLAVLLLLAGISVTLFHVPAPVIIARMSGNRKGTGMSFFMTGGELARTVGPVTAVSAVSLMGLEGFWPVMLAGIAASGALYWRFRRIDLSFHNSRRHVSLGSTFLHIKKIMIPLAFIIGARSFMHASMSAFLPVFVGQHGGSLWLGGVALTIFEAAGVAGIMAAGPVSDILGRKKMLLISLAGAPVALLAFRHFGEGAIQDGTSAFFCVAALIVCGFTLLSTTPVMLALVQENAGDSPAAANGIFMMTAFVMRSSVVITVGLVADYAGLDTAFLLSAIAGAAGLPFIMMLPSGGGNT